MVDKEEEEEGDVTAIQIKELGTINCNLAVHVPGNSLNYHFANLPNWTVIK